MRKVKLAAAILAAVTGLLAAPGVASAASVKPAESVYTTSSLTREFLAFEPCLQNVCTLDGQVHFQVYSTYSASQIWINGHVSCSGDGAVPVTVTWCGVGGGNGTSVLNVGVNWQVLEWDAGGLYERMDLLAGHGGCTTWGTNGTVGLIYSWSNEDLVCEAGA